MRGKQVTFGVRRRGRGGICAGAENGSSLCLPPRWWPFAPDGVRCEIRNMVNNQVVLIKATEFADVAPCRSRPRRESSTSLRSR